MASHPIVLIHGLFMAPSSWEHWAAHYAEQGHEVHAPGWPGISTVASMRLDPSPIAGLGVERIVAHYDAFVRGLDRPPILIGHSIGGLVVQLLLDRGLGAAGVAIHAAPAKGVKRVPLSTVRATWPVLKSPANRHRCVTLTDRQYQYGFANDLSLADATAERERYAIPGTGRALFDVGLANLTRRSPTTIDYRRSGRAPLLFIAGGKDHLVPPSVNRANARKYRKSDGIVEIDVFADRTHGTVHHDGWEAVADRALGWACAKIDHA